MNQYIANFSLLHLSYAGGLIAIGVKSYRFLRQHTPLPLALYCVLLIIIGLIFDNTVRAIQPIVLTHQDQDFWIWVVRKCVCLSYLLHYTILSSLYSAGYYVLEHIYPRSDGTKPSWFKLQNLFHSLTFGCFVAGVADYFFFSQPSSHLRIVETFKVKLFKAEGDSVFPLIVILGSLVWWFVLSIMAAVKLNKYKPMLMFFGVFAVFGLFRPSEDKSAAFNWIAFVIPNFGEVLYMTAIMKLIKAVYVKDDQPLLPVKM